MSAEGAIAVAGATLHYRIDGSAEAPWVTLSNSIGASLEMWDGQVAALQDRYRLLRYDTRGHGRSAAEGDDFTFPMLVGDVVALWDALGIARSGVVGLSLGGMTALGLALDHPERVVALACCDARADAPPPYVELWNARIAAIRASGVEAVVEPTVERVFSAPFVASPSPVLDRVRAMVRATSANGYIGCGRALQRLAYLPRLGEIRAPALYVVGRQDAGAPPETMRAMHERTPGSRFVEIDPGGHLSNLENPADFNRALAAFLDAAMPRG